MKILIFTTGGIGDNLFATPFLRQLKKRKSYEIDVLAKKQGSEVFENNQDVDNVYYLHKNMMRQWKSFRLLMKLFQLFKLRRKFKGKYDVVVNLNKALVSNFVAKLLGGKETIGFNRKGEGKFLDFKIDYYRNSLEINNYINLLKYFDIKPDYKDIDLDLKLKKEEEKFAKDFFKKNKLGKKVIGICPGGQDSLENYTDLRRLPINKYEDLIQMLIKKNWKIILFGGKNNMDVENKLLRKFKSGVFSLIGKTTIGQTGAVMKKCEFVISHDSGCLHIATAVNKEGTIGIFGPTDPKRTAHPKVKIFTNDCDCKPVADIYTRISPEDYKHNCLEEFDIAKVLQYIETKSS